MKTQSIQQEILVITGTKFSSRQLAEKNEEQAKLSSSEYLENACWNGLLNEILPEIIQKTTTGKKLFLWYIRSCKSFLGIELSESAPLIEKELSVNPYFFVPAQNMN